MKSHARKYGRLLFAVGVGAAAMVWNGNINISRPSAFVSTADALVGQPLTPLSYAGDARRATRRAIVANRARKDCV